MVYDKEKLSTFSNAVKRETDSKIEQLKREVEEYEKAELEKVREDQYNRMFTYMIKYKSSNQNIVNQLQNLNWKVKGIYLFTEISLLNKFLSKSKNGF